MPIPLALTKVATGLSSQVTKAAGAVAKSAPGIISNLQSRLGGAIAQFRQSNLMQSATNFAHKCGFTGPEARAHFAEALAGKLESALRRHGLLPSTSSSTTAPPASEQNSTASAKPETKPALPPRKTEGGESMALVKRDSTAASPASANGSKKTEGESGQSMALVKRDSTTPAATSSSTPQKTGSDANQSTALVKRNPNTVASASTQKPQQTSGGAGQSSALVKRNPGTVVPASAKQTQPAGGEGQSSALVKPNPNTVASTSANRPQKTEGDTGQSTALIKPGSNAVVPAAPNGQALTPSKPAADGQVVTKPSQGNPEVKHEAKPQGGHKTDHTHHAPHTPQAPHAPNTNWQDAYNAYKQMADAGASIAMSLIDAPSQTNGATQPSGAHGMHHNHHQTPASMSEDRKRQSEFDNLARDAVNAGAAERLKTMQQNEAMKAENRTTAQGPNA